MATQQQANQYVLSGGGLHVTFVRSDVAGQPSLTYQDHVQTRQFSGAEVQVVDTAPAELVTVTTVMTIDTGSTTFTLVVPRVALLPGGQAHVSTVGITAVHLLTIDTPRVGQLDSFTVARLHGTASLIQT
jgi:hypothetical protein